jgi:iron(III) transport system substrate-binding protein
VLIYNDQLVHRNVPDSWADLTGVAWRGRIACPDPTVSATGCTALQALLLALPGEEEAVLSAFARNVGGVAPSAAAAVNAVADGSCYVGVTTEDLALQAADSGLSVTVVWPEEGTVLQPDCAAVVAGCAHGDNARAFIDFLLSSEVQTRMAEQFLRPIRDAGSGDLPPALAYDPYGAGAHQAELLTTWRSLTAEETA